VSQIAASADKAIKERMKKSPGLKCHSTMFGGDAKERRQQGLQQASHTCVHDHLLAKYAI
jgi:hypothetical protein